MAFIKLALAVTMISTLVFGDSSAPNVSGNITIASNGIWRGMSQTSDTASIQSAINLDYQGFYLGAAGSNVNVDGLDATIELDVLGGYMWNLYGMDYDLGAIYYTYPKSPSEANFADLYFSLGKDFEIAKISAKYYRGIKTNDSVVSNAFETSLSIPLPLDISLDTLYGQYHNIGNYYNVGFSRNIYATTKASISYMRMNTNKDGGDEKNILFMLSMYF